MDKTMSRRAVLLRALQLPLAGSVLLGLSACDAGGDAREGVALVCADPDTMTSAQESVRRTLRYSEQSPDSNKACSGCAFFSAAQGGCGSCSIFDGNVVNPAGHCDSWSAAS
ncbi:high-potential iron-sulfur protein [Congregibacter sp.]|uniref:high-potential iron-sulfur protein n=1 Tax=Congregibacter sp. TaxID=2744308 RepID=UPI003F6AA3B9